MSNLLLIIRREYLERVRKKSFLITTLLMPVLMLAISIAPALIMLYNEPEHNTLAVIDASGRIAPALKSTTTIDFVSLNEPADSAVSHGAIDGYIVIPSTIMNDGKGVQLMINGAAPLELEESLSSQISEIIENERLLGYNITNIKEILDNVKAEVVISTVRLDKAEGESLSTTVSFIIGIVMSIILYMFLLMYGQMVMTSIIEEKNNRVLEIVVSSTRPLHLMMGKILGIGLVAVTQVIIWGIFLAIISAILLPSIMPAETMGQIADFQAGSLQNGVNIDLEMINTMSLLTDVTFIIQIFAWLILFLIGGFLLYAALFAAVGSAVDNVQDAAQFQSFIIIPIVLGLMVSMSIGNTPNSDLSLWMSFIPFTSPMVMMSRIPFGIPTWQIWVSLLILYAGFVGMVWIAGKVYRIGIFMYGKKPNIRDLIKWARYK